MHIVRGRERKKSKNKLFILKESDYQKLKITSQQFHSRKSRIHIDTAVKI